jgi:hypothetical protein
MAKQIKRQTLLSSKPVKKKPQQAKKQQPAPAQARAEPRKQKMAVKKGSGVVKKFMMTILGLAAIVAIIAPKPQLLIYKKLNLTANSIYLPGWFGQPGRFLDSNQRVVIDEQLSLVYLCFDDVQDKEKCNRYQFIEQKSMFAALGHYLDNK